MDNVVALLYLIKMGGTRNKVLSQLSKEIWDYLIKNKMITAEYLPGKINKKADFQSQNMKDSSKWKLNPVVFKKTCHWWGTSRSSLFVVETRPSQQR